MGLRAVGICHSVLGEYVTDLIVGIALAVSAGGGGQPIKEVIPEYLCLTGQRVLPLYHVAVGVPSIPHTTKSG